MRDNGSTNEVNETRQMLLDMAERLFSENCDKPLLARAEAGQWPDALWAEIKAAGLPSLLVPEALNGAGLQPSDALALARIGARYAAPLPLGETMIAQWLAAQAGLVCPAGPLTFATGTLDKPIELVSDAEGARVSGTAHRVAFASNAAAIVVLCSHAGKPAVAIVAPTACTIAPAQNLACEPRDGISFDTHIAMSAFGAAPESIGYATLRAFGAALRTAQIAGALNRVLDECLAYAQDRVQFGKPIAKFQAVQHNLAVLAGHAAAATAAADMAADGADNHFEMLLIGAAKARAGEAASAGAAIAHQLHGAIGFSQEHLLHYFTKRLWSWRDEFGKESEWTLQIGRAAAAVGPEALWARIVAA